MNRQTIMYIEAVAEAQSFSKASDKLEISQPALSAQIKRIEDQLGIEIFDRTVKPLEVTEKGKRFIEYLRKSEILFKDFINDISDIDNLKTGQLVLGGATVFNIIYMPEVVSVFNKKYPGVEIRIDDDNVPGLIDRTLNDEIDLFISSPVGRQEGIVFEKLFSTNIYLCVPPQAEINREMADYVIPFEDIDADKEYKEIDLDKFLELPVISLDSDRHLGKLMKKLLGGRKVKSEIIVDQSITSYAMTTRGVGISLMAGVDIRNISQKEKPVFYMANRKYCKRDMYVAYRRGKSLSNAEKEFIRILKDSVRHL